LSPAVKPEFLPQVANADALPPVDHDVQLVRQKHPEQLQGNDAVDTLLDPADELADAFGAVVLAPAWPNGYIRERYSSRLLESTMML
jgi:hypothetical protein